MLICKECGKSHKEYYYLAGGPFGVGEILCKGCWEKYLKVEGDREYRVRMLWAEKQQFQKQWEREHNQDIYCCRDPKWEQLQITLRSFMRGKKYDYTRLRNARLITESQSHYFETVTLPAEQEAVRKAKEERLRAEQEAEKKRIAEEKERKKKEEDERKRKEEELRPLEDLIMSNYLSSNLSRYLSVEKRIKVAKETYREEVMLRCVLDLESSVVNALMYNPNITDKVRKAVSAKKEVEKKKLADEKARREAARLEEERRRASIKTTIYWIIGLAIAGGLIWLIVEFWEAILAILLIIFLLVLFLK